MPNSFVVPPLELRRTGLTLLFALGLITALTIFFVREAVDLRRVMNDIKVNDLARIEIHNTLTSLLDAETGQRGFLLTGNDDYLAPYRAGKDEVHDSLRAMENSEYRDTSFLLDIRDLSLLTEAKLEELERTITLKKRGDSAGAIAIVQQGRGQALMLEARRTIEAQLNQLRKARDNAISDFKERLVRSAAILVTILTAVVFLSVHSWRTLTEAARDNNDLARRLGQEASHDALTNLPNRRFFDRWAKRLVARNAREYKPFSVLLVDLDGFKKVNDSLGHAIGDDVLREAAVRMQNTLRCGEFIARLGGDEFGIIIEGEMSRTELSRVGTRIIESLKPSLHIKLPDSAVGASIGVAAFPLNGSDLESLIEAADVALYESKDRGRGTFTFSSRIHFRRNTVASSTFGGADLAVGIQ